MFANFVTAEEVSARLIFSDDNATESLRLVMVVCYELCINYLVTAFMNCLVCESRISHCSNLRVALCVDATSSNLDVH
jgi:hypothetical protein